MILLWFPFTSCLLWLAEKMNVFTLRTKSIKSNTRNGNVDCLFIMNEKCEWWANCECCGWVALLGCWRKNKIKRKPTDWQYDIWLVTVIFAIGWHCFTIFRGRRRRSVHFGMVLIIIQCVRECVLICANVYSVCHGIVYRKIPNNQ